MMAAEQTDLAGELRYDEPLSRHTTWRGGGAARRFYRPADAMDLVAFLEQLPGDEPLLWLGMGSNLLVREGGFNGTVLATQGCLNELELREAGLLRVEAGVACPKVARAAAKEGLCGLEFLAGIPGTMGGALAMNAGAFGAETWQFVEKVEIGNKEGRLWYTFPLRDLPGLTSLYLIPPRDYDRPVAELFPPVAPFGSAIRSACPHHGSGRKPPRDQPASDAEPSCRERPSSAPCESSGWS